MLQTLARHRRYLRLVQTSCGVLLINPCKQILLGHVSDKTHWDLPKGRQRIGESTLETAQRELKEETGLEFQTTAFRDVGCFDYRPDKRLHLYKIEVPEGAIRLEALCCTSFFPRPMDREPILALDKFRWCTRAELPKLCLPRMAERLLLLEW